MLKRKKNRMRYEAKNDIIWSVLVGSSALTRLESLLGVNPCKTDWKCEEMP